MLKSLVGSKLVTYEAPRSRGKIERSMNLDVTIFHSGILYVGLL